LSVSSIVRDEDFFEGTGTGILERFEEEEEEVCRRYCEAVGKKEEGLLRVLVVR
jgi:hypothetical protein